MATYSVYVPEIDRSAIYVSVTETFYPLAFMDQEHADHFIEWAGDALDDARNFSYARLLYGEWFDEFVDEESGELRSENE